MRDIYHQIVMITPDFANHTEEDLVDCVNSCEEAVLGITSALTLIGNLTLDATANEDYSNENARRDLMLLGDTLRNLPRISQAIGQSADTASYVIRKRKGWTE